MLSTMFAIFFSFSRELNKYLVLLKIIGSLGGERSDQFSSRIITSNNSGFLFILEQLKRDYFEIYDDKGSLVYALILFISQTLFTTIPFAIKETTWLRSLSLTRRFVFNSLSLNHWLLMRQL